jgi:hypothetical protein
MEPNLIPPGVSGTLDTGTHPRDGALGVHVNLRRRDGPGG